MSLGPLVVRISNELFEHSNLFAEIRCDAGLPMAGMAFVEVDIHGRARPVVVLNPMLVPQSADVAAHILGHEWGHHAMRHIEKEPPPHGEAQEVRDRKEDEADAYAADFMQRYGYDLGAAEAYLRRHSGPELERRLRVLREAREGGAS